MFFVYVWCDIDKWLCVCVKMNAEIRTWLWCFCSLFIANRHPILWGRTICNAHTYSTVNYPSTNQLLLHLYCANNFELLWECDSCPCKMIFYEKFKRTISFLDQDICTNVMGYSHKTCECDITFATVAFLRNQPQMSESRGRERDRQTQKKAMAKQQQQPIWFDNSQEVALYAHFAIRQTDTHTHVHDGKLSNVCMYFDRFSVTTHTAIQRRALSFRMCTVYCFQLHAKREREKEH